MEPYFRLNSKNLYLSYNQIDKKISYGEILKCLRQVLTIKGYFIAFKKENNDLKALNKDALVFITLNKKCSIINPKRLNLCINNNNFQGNYQTIIPKQIKTKLDSLVQTDPNYFTNIWPFERLVGPENEVCFVKFTEKNSSLKKALMKENSILKEENLRLLKIIEENKTILAKQKHPSTTAGTRGRRGFSTKANSPFKALQTTEKMDCNLDPRPNENKSTPFLVGILLGKGSLVLNGKKTMVLLRLPNNDQNLKFAEFLHTLYSESGLCSKTSFKALSSKRLVLSTFAFKHFNALRSLFYKKLPCSTTPKKPDNYIKKIPDKIAELLSKDALAIWFMDSGLFDEEANTFVLKTNRYTLTDVEILQRALQEKLGFMFTITQKPKLFSRRLKKDSWFLELKKDTEGGRKFIAMINPLVIPSKRLQLKLPDLNEKTSPSQPTKNVGPFELSNSKNLKTLKSHDPEISAESLEKVYAEAVNCVQKWEKLLTLNRKAKEVQKIISLFETFLLKYRKIKTKGVEKANTSVSLITTKKSLDLLEKTPSEDKIKETKVEPISEILLKPTDALIPISNTFNGFNGSRVLNKIEPHSPRKVELEMPDVFGLTKNDRFKNRESVLNKTGPLNTTVTFFGSSGKPATYTLGEAKKMAEFEIEAERRFEKLQPKDSNNNQDLVDPPDLTKTGPTFGFSNAGFDWKREDYELYAPIILQSWGTNTTKQKKGEPLEKVIIASSRIQRHDYDFHEITDKLSPEFCFWGNEKQILEKKLFSLKEGLLLGRADFINKNIHEIKYTVKRGIYYIRRKPSSTYELLDYSIIVQ